MVERTIARRLKKREIKGKRHRVPVALLRGAGTLIENGPSRWGNGWDHAKEAVQETIQGSLSAAGDWTLTNNFPPNPDNCRSEERRVGKECRSRWSPYH